MVRRKTHEEFVAEVKALVGDEYTVVGKYVNAKTRVDIRHTACGNEYKSRPTSFLCGRRCPNCFGNPRKTTEEFKIEVFERVGKDYDVIGSYKNSHTKIKILHETCGHAYFVTPTDFLCGKRCPRCSESKGEKTISEWLKFRGIAYEPQSKVYCTPNSRPLFFDFLVCGVVIEFDGKQHFEALEFFGGERALRSQQRRDRIKDKYCADNGIPLIRIPYWEYDNIDAILTEKLLPLITQQHPRLVS